MNPATTTNEHDTRPLLIIGGGLAGCEAAWQAAQQGVAVELYEMRPQRRSPAHVTDMLAELVCSNSLRGAALENAVGLLKEELFRLDSLIVACARETAVPAGGALAVDRERFGALVEARLQAHPRIMIRREEVTAIADDRPTIVACGPLPSDALAAALDAHIARNPGGKGRLHYYDAASPIVATESLDLTQMYAKSRYDKGDGNDYLNIPLNQAQYEQFVQDLIEAPKHSPKEFESDAAKGKIPYFEGCLPVEEIAARGIETLRHGPLKPMGLRDPSTGKSPHAVVQLRKENVSAAAYNLVGFQTRLTWPAQKNVFGKLPGLANADWLRYGVMHRNAFIDAPRLLSGDLRLAGTHFIRLAGQITGAEGYVEAAACGFIAGRAAAREMLGLPPIAVPVDTALGAVVAHLGNTVTPDFQPSNVSWAWFSPLEKPIRDKRERRALFAERALAHIAAFSEAYRRVPSLDATGHFVYDERAMGYIRKILTDNHPTLRKVAKKVDLQEIDTPLFQQLLEDMFVTMYDAPGIGLAAPQINVGKRIFVVDLCDDDEAHGPFVVINPKFTEKTGEIEATEGCLSVPGYVGEMTRFEHVTCTGLDRFGKKITLSGDGLFARCLQHEMDHLDGILYVDTARNVRLAETPQEHAVAEAALAEGGNLEMLETAAS